MVIVDVLDLPSGSYGYVPKPALASPIEFTMRVYDYRALGGHVSDIQAVETIDIEGARKVEKQEDLPDPRDKTHCR
jgi:hypothetical protein